MEERQRPAVQPFLQEALRWGPAGVHVRRPRDHQGGHGLDTLVWSLLGSVSASLARGGSSLERVHVSFMSLVTKAITRSDEDTDGTSVSS